MKPIDKIFDKNVEEMAKDIACKIAWDDDEIPTVDCLETAKRLYNAGYCKASDVAEEIFAEIEKEIEAAIESNYRAKREHYNHSVIPNYDNFNAMCDGKIYAMRGLLDFIAELKKKYIGKDTNVTTNTEDKGRDKLAEFGKYSPLSWKYTEEE